LVNRFLAPSIEYSMVWYTFKRLHDVHSPCCMYEVHSSSCLAMLPAMSDRIIFGTGRSKMG